MTYEEAERAASLKAIDEGYDQLIFRNKKKKYDIRRSTKADRMRPGKVVCFVRLFYKDHTLTTRVCNE